MEESSTVVRVDRNDNVGEGDSVGAVKHESHRKRMSRCQA